MTEPATTKHSTWNRTSIHDVTVTLDRLEDAVRQFGGIRRIARVDQADVAREGGEQVAPAEVLIIENPALVATLAAVDLELLIDLPIRVLVWQSEDGGTRVRTMPANQIAASSDHPNAQLVRDSIDEILGAWLDFAVSDAESVDLDLNAPAAGERRGDQDVSSRACAVSPRERASQFHPNFSRGQIDRNGDLVADDIEANSNGVLVKGRDAFLQRLRRYETPFPGLQLRDRIIIEDGQSAAVLYVLQGTHNGPYAGREATGALVEAFSAEIFDFDGDGLLSQLLTVTHLGHLKEQIHSEREVVAHQQVTLLPITPASAETSAALKAAARSIYDTGDGGSALSVFDAETSLILDGDVERGPDAWQARLQVWQSAFPNLTLTIERILQEHNRLVVSLVVRGTHRGHYRVGAGEPLSPTGRDVEFRAIDFLEFSDTGRLIEVVSVYNTDDIPAQLR